MIETLLLRTSLTLLKERTGSGGLCVGDCRQDGQEQLVKTTLN